MRKIVLAVAMGGGVGRLPLAPGTFGSLLGVGLWAVLATAGNAALAVGWLITLALAVWTSGEAQKLLGPDDGRIVVDEIAGQLTGLLLLPLRLDVALLGFGLFRLFDIWKPAPIGALEALPGGAGVTGDDLAAGLLANLVGQLVWRFALPEGLL